MLTYFTLAFEPERAGRSKAPTKLPPHFSSIQAAATAVELTNQPYAWYRVTQWSCHNFTDADHLHEIDGQCALDEAVEGNYIILD